MNSVTQLNTLLSQVQYLFLLLKQNLKLPDQIDVVRSYLLIIFNLDWGSVEQYLPSYLDWVFSIRFDFRVQYIVVVGLLPLIFSSFLLLQYLDAMGVASFFLSVGGTFALVSGIFGNSEDYELYYIIAGSVLLIGSFICSILSTSGAFIRAILGTISSILSKKNRGNISEIQSTLRKESTFSAKSIKDKILELVRYGGSGIILIVSGVLFTGVVRISWLLGYNGVESAIFDSNFTWLFYVLAAILILQGIIHLIAFIIIIIPAGSIFLNGLRGFIQALTLKSSFLILTFIFTPIIATLVTSFHCNTYTCPAGTYHRDRYLSDWKRNLPTSTQVSPLYEIFLSLTTVEKASIREYLGNIPLSEEELESSWHYDPTICQPCSFDYTSGAEYQCGNGRTSPFLVCPAKDISVLQTDNTVSCGTMQSYYMWGSGILLVLWCFGVPLLILFLILIAIRYTEDIQVDSIKDMEKSNPTIIDKIDYKIDKFWTKFWNIVLLKRCWPKFLKNHEYSFLYYPIGKLFDLLLVVLLYIGSIENILYTQRFSPPSKGIMYELSKAIQAFKNATKNSLSKDAAEIWFLRVGLLKNNLQHLYCNFEFRTRFFYLWEIIIKIFLTIVASALINYPRISVSVLTFTHLVIVMGWLFVQPYLNFFEDVLSFTLSLITLINHAYALLNVFFTPPWWIYFLLVFNILSPVLTVISIFLFYVSRSSKNNIRKKDQRYKTLKEQVEKADKDITDVSVKLITSFFFTVAIATVILLGFCFVGLSKDLPYLVPAFSSGSYSVRSCSTLSKLQFIEYGSWTSFTSHCCCHEDPYYKDKVYDIKTKDYKRVELWHCTKTDGVNYQKLRVREMYVDGELHSGLHLRPFCSSTFLPGVALQTTCSDSNEDFYYVAQYSGNSTIAFENKYLW